MPNDFYHKLLRYYKLNLVLFVHSLEDLSKEEVRNYEKFVSEIYKNKDKINERDADYLLKHPSFSKAFDWFVKKEYYPLFQRDDVLLSVYDMLSSDSYGPYLSSLADRISSLPQEEKEQLLQMDYKKAGRELLRRFKYDLYKSILINEIDNGIISFTAPKEEFMPSYFFISDSVIYLFSKGRKMDKFKMITKNEILSEALEGFPSEFKNSIMVILNDNLSESTYKRLSAELRSLTSILLNEVNGSLREIISSSEGYAGFPVFFDEIKPYLLKKVHQKPKPEKRENKVHVKKSSQKKRLPKGEVIRWEERESVKDIYPNALSGSYVVVKAGDVINAYLIKRPRHKRVEVDFIYGDEYIPHLLPDIEEEVLGRLGWERNFYHVIINKR